MRYHQPEQLNEVPEKTSTVRSCLALPAGFRRHAAVLTTSVVSDLRAVSQQVYDKQGHKEWHYFY